MQAMVKFVKICCRCTIWRQNAPRDRPTDPRRFAIRTVIKLTSVFIFIVRSR